MSEIDERTLQKLLDEVAEIRKGLRDLRLRLERKSAEARRRSKLREAELRRIGLLR